MTHGAWAPFELKNFQQFLLQDGRSKRDITSVADVPQLV